MVLADTSAWIEYLRDTGSAVCLLVDELLSDQVATCAAVRMELLAGARNQSELRRLEGLLARATDVPTEPADYDAAAALYRRCRQGGATIRNMLDCLIAAIAIRNGLPVLHNDADFDALSRHTELRIYSAQA